MSRRRYAGHDVPVVPVGGSTTGSTGTAEVAVGSRVRVRDADGEFECTLVDGHDSDFQRQLISVDSPLGRALAGRRAGELVTVVAPAGKRAVVILEVS
jgi:transcription elongation factor GreA